MNIESIIHKIKNKACSNNDEIFSHGHQKMLKSPVSSSIMQTVRMCKVSTNMRALEFKSAVAMECFGMDIAAKKLQELTGREKPDGQYHMRYTPADLRAARYRYAGVEMPDLATPSLPIDKPPPVIVTRMTKGGVGKTSTSVNLAAAMAMMGYRILLIDADAQASASNLLLGKNYISPVTHHIGDFLTEAPNTPSPMLDNAIVHVYDGGFLDIIPSDIRLTNADASLSSGQIIGAHERAHKFFSRNSDYLSQRYDAIIVDTAPGTTPITLAFTYAAKTAGKILVVVEPVGDCLLALEVLSSNLEEIEAATDTKIGIHILVNKVNTNYRHVKENFGLLYGQYANVINPTVVMQYSGFARQMNQEDSGDSKPLVESHPTSSGASNMFSVAKSLIQEFGITMPGMPIAETGSAR
jgi:chromosome partitioning protein